MKSTNFNFP